MSCEVWRDRIDAYADGETPEPELAGLEEHLGTCRECSAQALARMRMKRAIGVAAMRFKPSAEFRQRVQTSIAPERRRFAFWTSPVLATAAALVLAVAVSAMVIVRNSTRDQAVAQLLDMHVAALASSNPVDVVSSDRHTVKPWFQGKLPFTFNLPELQGSNYTLLGGRLVYFRGKPGAQLIYELRKHEFSVFIVADGGSFGLSDEKENGFSVESWTGGALRYVILSDAGATDVHALADLVRGAQR
jgi:anti-sigma factor RsiW